MEQIYFDNSATSPVDPEVVKVITKCYQEDFGNPSSLHKMGLKAERLVEQSRKLVARQINCNPQEIVFTSGGTESNNIAIKGAAFAKAKRGKHIITTKVEHSSVLAPIEQLVEQGYSVTYVSVDQNGLVNLDELKNAIRPDTTLISVMFVNNELGTIQPIAEIGEIVANSENKPLLHVDAVQAMGKMRINLGELPVDLLSFSGHKFHGPKGIGGLYVRKGLKIQSQIVGGGQEGDYRAGTENVPGIVGMAKALEISAGNLDKAEEVGKLRQRMIDIIDGELTDITINSNSQNSIPFILNISFPGVKGEVLLHYLEGEGIYVSTGSACSSRSRSVSHVLSAIGLNDEEMEGAIRFSFSHYNTLEQAEKAARVVVKGVNELRMLMRR
ncbi:cysteine desulfurase [Desulfitispora alkaliphila]|uniref:cysteine desulfurase family protein n=1 Tax=Desulfitispora alkaliphila TaxID=622674 RepID=UPI003D19F4B1